MLGAREFPTAELWKGLDEDYRRCSRQVLYLHDRMQILAAESYALLQTSERAERSISETPE